MDTENRLDLIREPFIVRLDSEMFFSILLLFIWSKTIFTDLFITTIIYVTHSESLAYWITNSIVVICLLGSMNIFRKSIKVKDLCLFLFLIAGYIVSGLLHPSNQIFLFDRSNIIDILFQTVPMMFIGIAIKRKHFDVLYKISILSLYLTLFFIYIFNIFGFDMSDERMGLAYALLIHTSVLAILLVEKFTFFRLVTFAIGLFMIIGAGTRGPLLLEILFISIYYIYRKYKSRKRIILIFSSILIIAVIYNYMDEILDFLSSFFNFLGLSTRSIDMARNNNFMDDNGRKTIQEFLENKIAKNPKGYGLGYDHLFEFAYAHNFLLELEIAFGVLGGKIIFGITTLFVVSGFLCAREEKQKALILALIIGSGFVVLFFSGSFLTEEHFYLLIGLSISAIRYRTKRKKNATFSFK